MSNIALFTESAIVEYRAKNGASQSITVEGALFKGGRALSVLKGTAVCAAIEKAQNGRYRPAAEIMATGFPSIARAAEKLVGSLPWSNKTTMAVLTTAVLQARPGKSGTFTAKQFEARSVARHIAEFVGVETPTVEVIDAE